MNTNTDTTTTIGRHDEADVWNMPKVFEPNTGANSFNGPKQTARSFGTTECSSELNGLLETVEDATSDSDITEGRQDQVVASARAAVAALSPVQIKQLCVELEELQTGRLQAALITGVRCQSRVAILPTIACLLGYPIKYPGEGDFIMEIRETGADRRTRPGFANSREFPIHTDLSYVTHPPQFMCLHTIMNEQSVGGRTLLAFANDGAKALGRHHTEILSSPSYRFPSPPHYKGSADVERSILDPGPSQGWYVRYRRDSLEATSADAMRSAAAFGNALDESRIDIHLPNNSILILNNWTTLHGRTAFKNEARGAPRHINRLYAATEPPNGAYCD